MILALLLSACAGAGAERSVPMAPSAPPRSGGWAPFGPFLAPRAVADETTVPGPTEIFVPAAGSVRLDADALLRDPHASVWVGGIRKTDDWLAGIEIEEEQYTFTRDGERPLIAGIARFRRPASGDDPEQLVTASFGVDVSRGAAETTNVNVIFRGADHTSALAATSDAGVVVVGLEGPLLPDRESMTRIVGVDVVRGTEVWFAEDGRLEPGADLALWFTPECRVQSIETASGVTLWEGRARQRSESDGTEPVGCPVLTRVDSRSARLLQGADSRTTTGAAAGSPQSAIVSMRTGGRLVEEFSVLDPEGSLGVSETDPESGIRVLDRDDGSLTFAMDAGEVRRTGFRVEALFEGRLYGTTDSGRVMIDARTGAREGEWDVYPLARVGDSLWMSDGTLAPGSRAEG